MLTQSKVETVFTPREARHSCVRCRLISYIACLPRAKLWPSSLQERQETAASSCRPVSYIACLPRAKLWPSSLQERHDTAASRCGLSIATVNAYQEQSCGRLHSKRGRKQLRSDAASQLHAVNADQEQSCGRAHSKRGRKQLRPVAGQLLYIACLPQEQS